MTLKIDRNTKVIVQGITGKEGGFHALKCQEYGTQIVGGVTPGKGGQLFNNSIPVFNSVIEAIDTTDADTSLIFVPAPFAPDAILESIDSGIETVICITEGVPVNEMIKIHKVAKDQGVTLIGPNCPGVINPKEECKIGIMPGDIFMPGNVGVVSRSGTLTYEAVDQLSKRGIGQSLCIGIGGDPIVGTSFIDVLDYFISDDLTQSIVFIGEIGGIKEQEAAEFLKSVNNTKPIAALIVGASAPKGKRMGHAGAVISGEYGKAESKINSLKDAGCHIIPHPGKIAETVEKIIN